MKQKIRSGGLWAAVSSLIIVGIVYVLLPTVSPFFGENFAEYSQKVGTAVPSF